MEEAPDTGGNHNSSDKARTAMGEMVRGNSCGEVVDSAYTRSVGGLLKVDASQQSYGWQHKRHEISRRKRSL